MPEVSRQLTVPYTTEQMYALVNTIEDYPEFLPWCTGSEIISRNEDEVLARVEVSAAGFHKSFTTRNLLQKNKMMEIRLVDGPFKHLEGFWRFDQIENGHCRVSFDLEFEFAGHFLDFAFSAVFQQMASTFIDAFHERAKEKYGINEC